MEPRAVFGELRELLAGRASQARWDELTRLVEQAREHEQGWARLCDEGLPYARQALRRWPASLPREAPSAWVSRLAGGVDQGQALALANRVKLRSGQRQGAEAAAMQRLRECPYVEDVQALLHEAAPQGSLSWSASQVVELLQAPPWRMVSTLRLGELEEVSLRELPAQGLHALELVWPEDDAQAWLEGLEDLADNPWLGRLRALGLGGQAQVPWLELPLGGLLQASVTPRLRELRLIGLSDEALEAQDLDLQELLGWVMSHEVPRPMTLWLSEPQLEDEELLTQLDGQRAMGWTLRVAGLS